MQKDIYIVGAGTYGEVMFELAELLGYTVKGFYDEDESKLSNKTMGVEIIGKFSLLNDHEIKNKQFIVAIGNNTIRYNIMTRINQYGGKTPTLIHPKAVLSPSTEIGNGVYIHANANIWTKVKIGDFCIISPNVVIAHHSAIGKACLVSTLCGVGASINVEDKVFIGMGSTIVTGLSVIGENTIIGAGAVVLKNADKNCVYAGIPAKKLRSLTNDQEIESLENI
ncbi:NeuD/PglB/VioB family sugar acetyltransferase [Bacillus firmus]|uniref:NeuD/PglB/VioB family sugar acetyltransferase n=1 Tax=Cytobacillus firmus TaxID=1399 RepID=UPI001580681C|nr:NeuD/PglB/VioB family sugar acetyltransferase [Cytobacillus firmus]NUH83397.1 NeuD/PglB/VioB family sugar acetyltransferase [Cytobacillus firmus]